MKDVIYYFVVCMMGVYSADVCTYLEIPKWKAVPVFIIVLVLSNIIRHIFISKKVDND